MKTHDRIYNSQYEGKYNAKVAFPLGGLGAGMFCLEGTGAMTHFSLRNTPDLLNEPIIFSAVHIRDGNESIARVLEGPVQDWKIFNSRSTDFGGAGNGQTGKHYGLPRFAECAFTGQFPFGRVNLRDDTLPIEAVVTGWSPFDPADVDHSSLPVAALEITLINRTKRRLELIYSFHATNFMKIEDSEGNRVAAGIVPGGFILEQDPTEGKPWEQGAFSAAVDHPNAVADCSWFRGGWFDPLTMLWNAVETGVSQEKPPLAAGDRPSPGASLYVPLTLEPEGEQQVRLQLCWYVPESNVSTEEFDKTNKKYVEWPHFHKPWYAGRFGSIKEVAQYWKTHYDRLRERSALFSDTFFDTTMPPELTEAVAANLSILKSPTVLRQTDGRLWGWEGCFDLGGCCHGTCTHVWNYAQAIPHLFPSLERGIRETELGEGMDERGHQTIRVPLPIRPADHEHRAASDGQLGGLMRVYREWKISGDTAWMKRQWPKLALSLQYAMDTWDPDRQGILVEPHHNTYDIEFWGPDGMCTSIYLGALKAASLMAAEAGESAERIAEFEELYRRGRDYMENELFNGEYFEQQIKWIGLREPAPTAEQETWNGDYSEEAIELLRKEGPKYQYGKGCLSDGVIGAWLAHMCGLGHILDPGKVRSHLISVYRYNHVRDLSVHANPQRPGFALGREGGLLLCTWPKGGKLSLPFIYSNEVWTGIEYQVASHLLTMGCVEEALDIVRVCRDRYDGSIRNPYDEYECGHWYARAMASYGLIQSWSGVRYDASNRVLYLEDHPGKPFRSFLSVEGGYGTIAFDGNEVSVEVKSGSIPIDNIVKAAGG